MMDIIMDNKLRKTIEGIMLVVYVGVPDGIGDVTSSMEFLDLGEIYEVAVHHFSYGLYLLREPNHWFPINFFRTYDKDYIIRKYNMI